MFVCVYIYIYRYREGDQYIRNQMQQDMYRRSAIKGLEWQSKLKCTNTVVDGGKGVRAWGGEGASRSIPHGNGPLEDPQRFDQFEEPRAALRVEVTPSCWS